MTTSPAVDRAEPTRPGGGIALYTFADRSDADITGYLLALGIGSLATPQLAGRTAR